MWTSPRRGISLNARVLLSRFALIVLVLLMAGASARAQSGPIALVRHASKDAGTSTSSTLAFPANNTAGNWIGVVVRAGALNEVVTVSDTNHNVYQKAFQFNQTTDGFTFTIFYAESIAGGANTVTVSQSISGTLRFAILEYSGVAAAGSLDVIGMAQGHSTAPSSAPAVGTTANGDLLLGAVMTGNPQNATAGTGYTIEESVPAIPNSKLIVEDQIQSVAGATLANATISSADDWGAGFAAFKVSNGSGGSPNISGLNPTSGAVSTTVVISGTNFGGTQGTSTVKFNGTLAVPTVWSATSITAPAPSGATTGSVVVNVGGTNSNGVTFTVNTPPSVTINQAAGQVDPTSASPINFTTVFSAAVTGFTSAGVTLGGTAGATTVVVTGGPTTYNVAVSGMTQSGTVTASIPAGVATANGLTNTASTSTDNTVTFNVVAPSVTINQAAGQADPTSSSPINFTAVFSTTVTGFTATDVTLGGTAGAITVVVSGAGPTYNVAVSGMTQSGTVTASIPAGVVTANGVGNTASTSTDNTVTFNVVAPSVTINQAASQTDPTSASPINFTTVFSTTVTGFTNADVTLGGTAGATTVVVTGGPTTYNVAVSGMTQSGTVTASIPAGVVTANGVLNTASTSTDNTVTFNSPAPSVTINQASGQADPTNSSPINFTAVFSTTVTGFTATDLTLSGTAGATTVVVTGAGPTYNVAVSGMTQSGTVNATIPAGVVTANGVANTASTSTDNTVTYDITAPTVTINQAASQVDPTGTSPINFTAVFSEAVTGFTNTDVTLGGTAGATTAVVTGSGPSYNVAVSGMTQSGTVTASIGAGVVTDLAGNPNAASTSTDNTVTYNPQAGLVASYSFEENSGTTTADSSGNNNNGTLSTGVTWTTGKVGNAVSFPGNAGDISIPDSPSLDFTGSFTLSGWVKPATVTGYQTVLIKESTVGCAYFWQIVNGQIDSGFNKGSGCVEHVATTATLTPGTWYYVAVTLDHSSNTYNTYLNGSLIASTTETGLPVANTQPLTMGRSGCAGCGFERYNGVLDEVKIYSRALSATEVLQQFNAVSGAPTITGLNPTSGGVGASVVITGTNFGSLQGTSTVKFNGLTAAATAWSATSLAATVPTGATTGNVVVTVGGLPSNGVSFTVSPQPSVTINQATGQADPTKNSPINFTVVFSTAVTGFTNTGVALGGTVGATTAVVTGSGATYNVAVSGMTQSGSVTATIPAGVATSNGSTNTASTSTDNTVTYDITPPSVTINQAASQTDPTAASPINFTAVFSEAVTGFTNTGVTLGGTAGATAAVVTGSGTTYNVAVSGVTQTGTVTATIGAGKANDLAGNPNTASTSTDNSVTYNASAPTVTINQAAAQADPTNGSTINFAAVFSVAVTGFVNGDVTLGGTAGATTVAVTGGPITYNVAVSGMTQSGTVTAAIPAGVATGNGTTNTASTSTDNTVTYDITQPTVTVNQAASQADPTGASPINFTVVFSEPVTSFTNVAVTLGGTAGATTAVVTGSGPSYNVAVSGMTQSGTVTASIGAAKVTDLAGNPNTASTSTDNSVTYNAQSGLVASYSFSEGSGTTTADSSGNNNNGTLSSGVTWTTGQVGNAISFNGSSGNVTVNDSASLDFNGSFTLSGWVKQATNAGTQTVLIKETTSGCGYFWQIVNGQIDSGFNNGSGCVEHVATTATLTAGTWYFVVVTLDHSSNTYNTYLNGSLIATTTETGVPVPNTQSLMMGQSGDAGGGFERYNGVLDEVKIYNRALSLSEVQQQYNGGLGAPTISGLNPTSGPIGTSVVISGTNFGTTQSSSTVKFNGVTATPTGWSATSITTLVPGGATTGNVVVTVGGVASNGMTFTVASTSLNVTISPKRAAVTLSQPQQFTGTVNNDPLNGGITWSVDGVNSGNAASGTVSASGLYTPGTQVGVHTVMATSNSNTSVIASSTVAVTDLAGVFTYHNDTARTGQNPQEYALTTSTVNSSTFGALFTCGGLDGYLYAAPLYYANLNVGGVTRNVVFVATEHDSVYAFDADSPACVQLWKTSFISPPNVVPVAPADVDELSDLTPEIGITSTPVIDSTSHTIYVMAKTKEFVGTVSGVACTSSAPCFVHRLHALSVTDGTEKVNSPVVVTAPNFNPLTHLQRAGLLFNNGVVYVPIGSHGDNGVWQGWMMAYNATSLAQLWSYHTSDPVNGNNGGAIWGSGNAPALDSSGNIYFETGNGNYDGVNNWADSVIKLSPAGTPVDSFTPFDQAIMQQNDIDLGSSNPIILPDSVGSTAHPHLMIAMGKVGVIYLLDQTNMGGFNAAANQDVGEVSITFNTTSAIKGFFGQPAYWNGNIYEVVVGDVLRQLPISNGSIATSSISQSSNTFTYRAGTPVVSASGATNGIVWNLDSVGYKTSTPVVLYAYDATNLGTMLFSSPGSGAGSAPISVKFPVPTVANGKVYVGGQLAFTVFGLLPN